MSRTAISHSHSFTKAVVERTLRSHDISVTVAGLLRDREAPVNIKEHMDLDKGKVTYGIMKAPDILNKEAQSVEIDSGHMAQIKEYLTLLDLTVI